MLFIYYLKNSHDYPLVLIKYRGSFDYGECVKKRNVHGRP